MCRATVILLLRCKSLFLKEQFLLQWLRRVTSNKSHTKLRGKKAGLLCGVHKQYKTICCDVTPEAAEIVEIDALLNRQVTQMKAKLVPFTKGINMQESSLKPADQCTEGLIVVQ